MGHFKRLTLSCNCGNLILQYQKGGKGRWIKVHPSRVVEYIDKSFEDGMGKPIGTPLLCSECGKRIASIHLAGGKHVAKLNQGQVKIG